MKTQARARPAKLQVHFIRCQRIFTHSSFSPTLQGSSIPWDKWCSSAVLRLPTPHIHTAFFNSEVQQPVDVATGGISECVSPPNLLSVGPSTKGKRSISSPGPLAFFRFPPTTSAVAPTSSLVFFLMLHTLACGSKLPTP